MRAILFVFGTVFLIVVVGLLAWRPDLVLALALLTGAVNVWRMRRPHRVATAKPVAAEPDPVPVPVVVALASSPPAEPYIALLDRIRGAGWLIEPARSPSPWLVAACGGVRVAVHPAPGRLRASGEDIVDALAAKVRERAQYAAIVCEQRPSDAVAALAKDSRIHIVNLARLDAYLALAGSFKPGQPQAAALRRVPA